MMMESKNAKKTRDERRREMILQRTIGVRNDDPWTRFVTFKVYQEVGPAKGRHPLDAMYSEF